MNAPSKYFIFSYEILGKREDVLNKEKEWKKFTTGKKGKTNPAHRAEVGGQVE
jgi:hypothetical protein